MEQVQINNNSLAFMALANEYCQALEQARDEYGQLAFINAMLRILPRIYISASDIYVPEALLEEAYIDNRLDEDYYDSVRRNIENLLGPDDTYLEVFHQDMKYSDTPIAQSVAEGLADIYQVLCNFLDSVRDMPDDVTMAMLTAVKEDFRSYWGQILCNVMRPLNAIAAGSQIDADADAFD
ncbi:DUF5063 domain-containing protein [uncultured Muribaculum sp.]|uniref:DUF5063 domain-containing protein n=1 Tax=uncultured Muribaculum sp. TaxID=1918613 RepID=UPI0025B74A2B|nr:DUF5063 domain-containing protein [uncultured Muribaculum sp.]